MHLHVQNWALKTSSYFKTLEWATIFCDIVAVAAVDGKETEDQIERVSGKAAKNQIERW